MRRVIGRTDLIKLFVLTPPNLHATHMICKSVKYGGDGKISFVCYIIFAVGYYSGVLLRFAAHSQLIPASVSRVRRDKTSQRITKLDRCPLQSSRRLQPRTRDNGHALGRVMFKNKS